MHKTTYVRDGLYRLSPSGVTIAECDSLSRSETRITDDAKS